MKVQRGAFRAIPLSSHSAIVQSLTHPSPVLMPIVALNVLLKLDSFRALADIGSPETTEASLAKHLWNMLIPRHTYYSKSEEALAGCRWLQENSNELLGKHILISEMELVTTLISGSSPEAEVPLDLIVIPTRGDYDLVYRCISSVQDDLSHLGRETSILVCPHRTRDAANAAESLPLYSSAYLNTPIVQFTSSGDSRFRTQWLRHLGDVAPEALDFLLFGIPQLPPSDGANRNLILLITAGYRALSIDDDSIIGCIAHPDIDTKITLFNGSEDPTELWAFPSRQAAFAFASPSPQRSLIKEHEIALGINIDQLATSKCDIECISVSPETLISILHRNCRIALTFCGLTGDCGCLSSGYINVSSRTESLRRICESEASYEMFHSSREVFRAVKNSTLLTGPPFMAGVMGFDNRLMLPPFFPHFRNSDGLFGHMTMSAYPGSVSCHLPFAYRHSPTVSRSYSADRLAIFKRIRFSELLSGIISLLLDPEYTRRIGEEIYTKLGDNLIRFASCSDKELHIRLSGIVDLLVANDLRRLSNLRNTHADGPWYWSRDVDAHMQCRKQMLTDPNMVVPAELDSVGGISNAIAIIRQLLSCYGAALVAWPGLWKAAKDMNLQKPSMWR